jgi:hypothetical protein
MTQGKSFPPIIDAKLPAFSGNTIAVTFEMNRTMNFNDIVGMSAIIKTATTGKVLATLTSGRPELDLENKSVYSEQKGKYIALFDCPENLDLKVG